MLRFPRPIIRQPRIFGVRRFPREKELFPRSENLIGFEFIVGNFPYQFILYLNIVGAKYTIENYEGKYLISVIGEPIYNPDRKIIRYATVIQEDGFIPFYEINLKPRDKFPELFSQLDTLKEKFLRRGRRLSTHCPYSRDRHISSLEVCVCRCKKKCERLNYRNLVGPGESSAEYIDDFLKFQRLVNLIYGTVRMKDIVLENNEPQK